jgi:hypothetical protein
MIVNVYHRDSETAKMVKVAEVDAGCDDVEDALEWAWVRTNNIQGSWSRGPEIDGQPNPDYSRDVKVTAPLPEYMGRTYGHRSSMVRDVFVIDGTYYVVATCGFKKVEGWNEANP